MGKNKVKEHRSQLEEKMKNIEGKNHSQNHIK